MLCISDGIAEVLDTSGAMWEEAEIEGVLLRNRNVSVAELVAAIVDRVERYSAGTDQYDDMTIAAVRIAS